MQVKKIGKIHVLKQVVDYLGNFKCNLSVLWWTNYIININT